MYYQFKVKRTITDAKGAGKTVTEEYITDALSFSETEATAASLNVSTDVDFDVNWIQRSPITEIINEKKHDDQDFYEATVADVFTSDEGKEKEVKYKWLIAAGSVENATSLAQEQLKQGYDMRLIAVKRTKIKDVVK